MASSKKCRHADLATHLASFLQRHTPPGSRLLLGLSGGLDSRVLLDLLVKLRSPCDFTLSALHVNHGISPHAGAWADFCARLCAAQQVPFKAVSVEITRTGELGLEAAAREVRYAALLAEPSDFLVLAHQRDDQAETLLLQLLRGAGVKGLAAMGEVVERKKKAVLRPLLDVPRAALLEYAQSHGLQWIEDESNLDPGYDRNFLRHHIVPQLEQRFPAALSTLARSARHLAEAASLLEELAALDAAAMVAGDRLELQVLRWLSPPRAKNLLRYWMTLAGILLPPSMRLEEMLRQLLEAKADARVLFRLGSYQLRRYRDHAWLVMQGPERPRDVCLDWQGEDVLTLDRLGVLEFRRTVGAGVRLERLAGRKLTVRLRQGGERLRPDAARPTRSLKGLLQDRGVPPWQRERLPLLYCGEELVAVPGIGIACDWQASTEEAGIVPIWKPGNGMAA
jgi:tRNA(Ile)-lysidine synthase